MSRLGHTTLNTPDHMLVSELTGQALWLQGHGQDQDLRTELSSLLILTPSPGYSLAGWEDLQILNDRGFKILQSRHKCR